jgi:hypothetical protein
MQRQLHAKCEALIGWCVKLRVLLACMTTNTTTTPVQMPRATPQRWQEMSQPSEIHIQLQTDCQHKTNADCVFKATLDTTTVVNENAAAQGNEQSSDDHSILPGRCGWLACDMSEIAA